MHLLTLSHFIYTVWNWPVCQRVGNKWSLEIRNNPNQSHKLLQYYEPEKLTAEVVDNQFQCVLSVEGSNKRVKEEAIAFNFTHYLEDVEEGLITTTVLDPETDEIHTSKVELAHVLQFVTGCPALPATEFDTNLTIVFYHQEIQRKLSTNTCSCTINIPVCDLLAKFTECTFSSPGSCKVWIK